VSLDEHLRQTLSALQKDPYRPSEAHHLKVYVSDQIKPILEGYPDQIGYTVSIRPRLWGVLVTLAHEGKESSFKITNAQ